MTSNEKQKETQTRLLIKEVVAADWQGLFLRLPIHHRINCLRRLVMPQIAESLKTKYPLILQ